MLSLKQMCVKHSMDYLKYKPRVVKYICHEEAKVHESHCLVDIYELYICLANAKNNNRL